MATQHEATLTSTIGACLARSRELINEAWQPLMQAEHGGRDTDDETRRLQQSLNWQLEAAFQGFVVLLELIGAPRAADTFSARWTTTSGEMSLALDAAEMDYVACPRFDLLSETFSSLVPDRDQTVILRAKQDLVKDALESTPKIVKLSTQKPTCEAELHTVVHEHMEATFPGYLRKAAIATSSKYYIPDGAFPALELAIEWKYVRDRQDFKRAIDEVKTDIASYGKSRQYTRFFGLFYQVNSSICTQQEIVAAFGNPTPKWDMILVTAP